MVRLHERLKSERLRLGKSQIKFAEEMGVSSRTQMHYESGERCPDLVYLEKAVKSGFDLVYVVTGVRASHPITENVLGPQESRLVQEWRSLDDAGRKAVQQMIAALLTK